MPSVTQAVLGQPYSYQVAATDDDGDPLTFSLSLQPGYEMSIDPRSGLVTSSWPEALFGGYVNEPLSFPYTVTVTDGKGGYATQTVNMVLECPAGKGWKFDWDAWSGSCQDLSSTITITSSPVLTGRAGETYTYQVSATDTAGGSLTFSLSGGPSGMVINAETGLVTWPVAGSVAAGGFPYQVRVSNDKGSIMTQNVNFGVCTVGKVWDTGMSMCM
jgi:hypothetical protein